MDREPSGGRPFRGLAYRNISLLEAVVIPLSSALLRVAWINPVLRLMLNSPLVDPQGVRYPGWLILLVLMGASITSTVLSESSRPVRANLVLGLTALVGVLAYSLQPNLREPAVWFARMFNSFSNWGEGIPAPFVVGAVTLALWRRGMSARWHDYGQLYASFVLGFIVFGALMLVTGQETWAAIGVNLWLSVAAFVVSGLLALALLGAHEMLSWERFREASSPGIKGYWILAVGVLVAGAVAVGWIVGQVLVDEPGLAFFRLLRPLGELLLTLFEYLLLAFAYVFFHLFGGLIEALRDWAARNWHLLVGFLSRLLEWRQAAREGELASQGGVLRHAARYVYYLALVVGVGLALVVAFVRGRRPPKHPDRDMREFILSRALLNEQIEWLFSRLRPRRHRDGRWLALGGGQDARLVARRLYRRMLMRMEALGRARPPGLTPQAYARRLADAYPEDRHAVETLTRAYQVARYSPEPPSEQEILAASRALARLEEDSHR